MSTQPEEIRLQKRGASAAFFRERRSSTDTTISPLMPEMQKMRCRHVCRRPSVERPSRLFAAATRNAPRVAVGADRRLFFVLKQSA